MMFEVNVKGFAQLMAGRPKWHFVRELISNSLDEYSVSDITVELVKAPRIAYVTVTDNGDGFANLSDAYTLFAYTPKRKDAKVRGRFNMGEKELASIAREMTIHTTSGKVVFNNGKLRKHPRMKREKGTVVDVTIPMSNKEYYETIKMLEMFIFPSNKKVRINSAGVTLQGEPFEIINSVEETLPTVLLNSEINALTPTRRKTVVEVYKPFAEQEKGWLFELGIPVQEIDCNYNVNVQQKVPMNANRDTVIDSYLEKIYAIVLNSVANQLNEHSMSDTWVSQGIENDLSSDETLSRIVDVKYKDTVLRSSDRKANENAINDGKTILDSRHLSQIERGRLRSHGLVPSTVNYKPNYGNSDLIPKSKWSDEMKEYARITKITSMLLVNREVLVRYINEPTFSTKAQYDGSITYNIAHYKGKAKLDPYAYDNLGIILHELAHDTGGNCTQHDSAWWHRLADLGGMLLELQLRSEEK